MATIPAGNPFYPNPEDWKAYVDAVWARLTPEERANLCGPFPEENEYLDGMAETIAQQLFKNV